MNEISNFLLEINSKLEKSYKNMTYSLWMLLTTNDIQWMEKLEKYESLYQEDLTSMNIKKSSKKISAEDLDYRQLEILDNERLDIPLSNKLRNQMNTLWGTLNFTINSFSFEHNNKVFTENDALQNLAIEQDLLRRKELWNSYMSLGEKVYQGLIKLVKLRNRVAIENGFDNYYEMKMFSQELDTEKLNSFINKLRSGLDRIYNKHKAQIMLEISDKYNISPNKILPWHFPHPFLQRYHTTTIEKKIDIQKFKDFLLENSGINFNKLIRNSDIYERRGKSSANFCLNIDRKRDIRISSNLSLDGRGITGFLHELGHAVYEKGIDSKLPFLLRQPYIFLSEGVALLFERILNYNHSEETAESSCFLKEYQRNLLLKLYWTMVVIKFEQEMYKNPQQNLNSTWWDIVEEIQGVKRPENWNYPYWARISHLTTLPVYYQNYLLGEIVASQMETSLNTQFGTWFSKNALEHLKKNMFEYGKARNWGTIIEQACLSEMNLSYLIKDLQ